MSVRNRLSPAYLIVANLGAVAALVGAWAVIVPPGGLGVALLGVTLCCMGGGAAIMAMMLSHQVQVRSESQQRLIDVARASDVQRHELEQLNERLNVLLRTDDLTGLLNRKGFQEKLDVEFTRALRYHTPFSVVLMDLDRFKAFNDSRGHLAGDDALARVAGTLTETARTADVLARLGGDEFGFILPNTDTIGSVAMAERFRATISDGGDEAPGMTASFGIATWSPVTADAARLIAEADQALYASKAHGRDQVCHAADGEPTPTIHGREPIAD